MNTCTLTEPDARVLARWLEPGLIAAKERGQPLGADDLRVLQAVLQLARGATSAATSVAAPPVHVPEHWITTETAAQRLGITDRAVRHHCAAGRVPAVRCKGAWRLDPDALTARKAA